MSKIVRDLTAVDNNLTDSLQINDLKIFDGRWSCNQVQMNFNIKDFFDTKLDDDALARFPENTEDGKMLLCASSRFTAILKNEDVFLISNPHTTKTDGSSVDGGEKIKAPVVVYYSPPAT